MSLDNLPRSGLEMMTGNALKNADAGRRLNERTVRLAETSDGLRKLLDLGIDVLQYEDRREREVLPKLSSEEGA